MAREQIRVFPKNVKLFHQHQELINKPGHVKIKQKGGTENMHFAVSPSESCGT